MGTANIINSGDTAWVLISAALVFIMTPAVALFYGVMVRSKMAFGSDVNGLIGDL